MIDLVFETCKYIYKNPNKSRSRYISEMSKRSLWSYSYKRTEEVVDALIERGVLKEEVERGFKVLVVCIKEYMDYYNVGLDSKKIAALDYILKNPKKSKNTYIRDLKHIIGEDVANTFFALEGMCILRCIRYTYNDFTYDSVYIDFYSLKILNS